MPCFVCNELKAQANKAKQGKVDTLMPNAQIGKRYHAMTFDQYKPADSKASHAKEACSRYAATFPDRLKDCDNILMIGNPGTGKNMLAACVCREVLNQGHTALHTTAIKLVRRIKETWSNKSETETQAITAFTIPDLLVIDEIGVQFGSKTEEMLLFEVINERYENMRPTILISNLNMDDIEKFLGARTMDRFCEGKSMMLQFTWDSYRRANR